MSDIDALLFDFGGIVVEIDFDRVFARWAEAAGVGFDQVKSRFSHGEAYQRFERGEIDAGSYFESLRHDLGIDLDDTAFADGWARVFGAEIHETAATLRRLERRVPLYLFSNTNALHYQLWSVRHAAALTPFRRQFLSFRMGKRKPERDAFDAVASEIQIPAARILFFDDTASNVEGARAAGMQAVHTPTVAEVKRAVAPWLEGARR